MFKVGDKVVRCGSIHYKSKSFSIWEVLAVFQTTIPAIEVAPLTNKGKVVRASSGVYVQQQFDHATPEEIAAGHRIDTNTGVTVITPSGTSKVKGGMTAFVDMGDDSHIENHVSPNCKKFDERVGNNETN